MFKNDRLQAAIQAAGISYNEVDRRMGWKNTTSKYARGAKTPTPITLLNILEAVGWKRSDIKSQRITDWYTIWNGNQADG